jgi:hypothetical protein|tara:strand:+ start:5717 stop:5887 length:171 start_codon:yes stop_codon:yes gene_type:complete
MASVEQLEKQIEVLTNANKLLTSVILEKNEMILCLEMLLKAEEYSQDEIPQKEKTH